MQGTCNYNININVLKLVALRFVYNANMYINFSLTCIFIYRMVHIKLYHTVNLYLFFIKLIRKLNTTLHRFYRSLADLILF